MLPSRFPPRLRSAVAVALARTLLPPSLHLLELLLLRRPRLQVTNLAMSLLRWLRLHRLALDALDRVASWSSLSALLSVSKVMRTMLPALVASVLCALARATAGATPMLLEELAALAVLPVTLASLQVKCLLISVVN